MIFTQACGLALRYKLQFLELKYSIKNHLYKSLNDIKVWRLISIFAKLDTFEENWLFEVVYVISKWSYTNNSDF